MRHILGGLMYLISILSPASAQPFKLNYYPTSLIHGPDTVFFTAGQQGTFSITIDAKKGLPEGNNEIRSWLYVYVTVGQFPLDGSCEWLKPSRPSEFNDSSFPQATGELPRYFSYWLRPATADSAHTFEFSGIPVRASYGADPAPVFSVYIRANYETYYGSNRDDDFEDVKTITIVTSSKDQKPFVVTNPTDASVPLYQSNVFRVVSYGTEPLHYQWRKDGVPISGATSGNFVVNGVRPADVGAYDVVITNAFGTVSSKTAMLAVLPPSLELVDPNAGNGRLISNGTVLANDYSALSLIKETVRGAAADGATQLLLRTSAPSLNPVTFSFVDASAPQDGALGTLGSTPAYSSVTVNPVMTGGGLMAYALYQAPSDFGSAGLERPVLVKVAFDDGPEIRTPIVLSRPPLLLVHGLWDSRDTWNAFPLLQEPRFSGIIYQADYRKTAGSAFAANVRAYSRWIENALKKQRDRGIAASRVDVIAHSMGGLLSRLYTQDVFYKDDTNFLKGSINRLIELNAPNLGSPLANILVAIRDNGSPAKKALIETLCSAVGFPNPISPKPSAIDDLAAPGNALPEGLLATSVPSHAIIGLAGPRLTAQLKSLAGWPGGVWTAAFFLGDQLDNIFGASLHDGIVSAESQQGDISSSATSAFFHSGSLHWLCTRDSVYADAVGALLDTPVTDPKFSVFPAVPRSAAVSAASSDVAEVSAEAQPKRKRSARIVTSADSSATVATAADTLPIGISISGLSGIQTGVPGSSIAVSLAAVAGYQMESVLLVGPDSAIAVPVLPAQVTVPLPSNVSGPYTLVAGGVTTAGLAVRSNTLTLQIAPAATLSSLTLSPTGLLLIDPGQSEQLTLTGTYADGSKLTTVALGAANYESSNPTVATVDASGVVVAVSSGTTTISASNGLVQAFLVVAVDTTYKQRLPRANAGPAQGVIPGTLVQLQGSASNLPANMSATYSWVQISGPATTLIGDTSSTASFTPSTAGTYIFALTVKAGQLTGIPNEVVVSVGSPAAPAISAANDQAIQLGQAATFVVSAMGIPTPEIQWWKNGQPINGATQTALVIPNVQLSDIGSYAAVATNLSGSVTSRPGVLTLNGPPVIVNQPEGKLVNAGSNATFDSFAMGTAPLRYRWRKNGVAISGATGASLTLTDAQPADAGTYDVVVSNGESPDAISHPATLNVVPTGVVATHAQSSYLISASDRTALIANRFAYAGAMTNFGWSVLLPTGWSLASSDANGANVNPTAGATGLLEWQWTTLPPSPITFNYSLTIPATDTTPRTLSALVNFKFETTPIQITAKPEPLNVGPWHDADTNHDGKLSLTELLRVIELYNTRNGTVRTGAYAVVPSNTEDGFAGDPTRTNTTTVALVRYHSADTSRDGMLNLTELLRMIELYNYRSGTVRTGQHHVQAGTEDGFAPGP